MLNQSRQVFCYYLFSFSNFIAALGGGLILGKGINTIDIPFLQGSSLLAFLVGTVLGLGFLKLLPKKMSQILARWFSICGGVVSLILFAIFIFYSTNEKISGQIAILFFLLLSVRFGFWFYSRVLRAAALAGQKQRIAWVELGYYTGIIAGLIFWIFLNVKTGMAIALLVDAFLQLGAGCLDLFVYHHQSSSYQPSSETQEKRIAEKKLFTQSRQKEWGWRLAIAVMLLTIGVQVIIFNLAHHLSGQLSSYVLATFYFGAATSAFFFKQWNIELNWNVKTNLYYGYASLLFGRTDNKRKISFSFGSFLSAFSVGAILIGVYYWNWGNHVELSLGVKEFLLLLFVFLSTFLYGTLELSILDRIGLEEKNSPTQEMVLHTYGLMSIGAVISLWFLQITNSSFYGLFLTLIICFLFTVLAIRSRGLQNE